MHKAKQTNKKPTTKKPCSSYSQEKGVTYFLLIVTYSQFDITFPTCYKANISTLLRWTSHCFLSGGKGLFIPIPQTPKGRGCFLVPVKL